MLPFVLCLLAVWRLTHLFTGEDGPWSLFVKLRAAFGKSFFGQLLDCFYCLSIWVGFLFALTLVPLNGPGPVTDTISAVIVHTLALSAGAILLERLTNPAFAADQTPVFFEEEPP